MRSSNGLRYLPGNGHGHGEPMLETFRSEKRSRLVISAFATPRTCLEGSKYNRQLLVRAQFPTYPAKRFAILARTRLLCHSMPAFPYVVCLNLPATDDGFVNASAATGNPEAPCQPCGLRRLRLPSLQNQRRHCSLIATSPSKWPFCWGRFARSRCRGGLRSGDRRRAGRLRPQCPSRNSSQYFASRHQLRAELP
jgi:hypothetical protein